MVAAIFPGQGSQKVGMGDFLLKNFSVARQTFEEASDTLGFDVLNLCLKGPEEKLKMTENTQPALLTVSIATYRCLQEVTSFKPIVAAGHSVGEYPAMVAANVFPFAKGLELVRLRGKLMQETVPLGEGGMLAVMGLTSEQVGKLCEWAQKESGLSPLEPANYNSPGQVVVSGNAKLIAWVQENFSAEKIGAKAKVRLIPLKVSAPFHCSMMQTAQDEMAGALNEVDFKSPHFPIVQNFTGQLESEPETLKKNLIQQISGAVRWVDCMQSIKEQGCSTICELGTGKVLTGLAKKIDASFFKSFNFNSLDELKHFAELNSGESS